MNEFGDNFITITDEDGVDYELEILATVENGGNLYYALAPAGDDEAEEDLEISSPQGRRRRRRRALCRCNRRE